MTSDHDAHEPEAEVPPDEDLVPPRFQRLTIAFLLRPPEPPSFSDAELDELQRAHLAHLRELGRRGIVLANGPFAVDGGDRVRGMSVYSVPVDEARSHAESDPMVQAGWLEIEVREWLTADGSIAFPPDAWPRTGPADQAERS